MQPHLFLLFILYTTHFLFCSVLVLIAQFLVLAYNVD